VSLKIQDVSLKTYVSCNKRQKDNTAWCGGVWLM
jgi:hypothetical protein